MTRFPKITICGVEELSDLDLTRFTHVISIWDPVWQGRDNHELQIRRKLSDSTQVHFAYFDDIPVPMDDRVAATLDQIREILAFGAAANERSSILIHCWAGVSRSSGVAYAVLCQAAGLGNEKECLAHLRKVRPQAVPNSLIVTLAEVVLNRDGAMFSAYDKMISSLLIRCDDDEL